MSLQGKIIEVGKGQFGFEYHTTELNRPIRIRQVWEICNAKTRGMSYCDLAEAIGRDASLTDGRVSCYLGNGNYFYGELPQLGSTKAAFSNSSAIEPPKVRKGIETRWQNGAWQKLLKSGWVAA